LSLSFYAFAVNFETFKFLMLKLIYFQQMVTIAEYVYQAIGDHPMFQANKNIWFHVYPGSIHSVDSWLKRMWNTFKILSNGRNWF